MAVKKKQALCIASVASNLDNFNRGNVEALQGLGYEVTIAANFCSQEDTNPKHKTDAFAKEMREKGVHIVQVDFSRNITKAEMQMKSVLQVRSLCKRGFELIHCHSPICAAIVRAAAQPYRKKYGTKVIYTAHGFHFYTGAPLKNWIFFYPVERVMSHFTDVLITINREDYKRAKKHFHAGKTAYIPGVGIDVNKYQSYQVDIEKKRQALGLREEDIMLLSVGELNVQKNHKAVIKAVSKTKDMRLHYFIAGIGMLQSELFEFAKKLGMEKNVHFLGYRTDILELCKAADLYIFPSLREGLPVALMEAAACKAPVICSRIRGNIDLVKTENCLFNPKDEDSLKGCLADKVSGKSRQKVKQDMQAIVDENYERVLHFDLSIVKRRMRMLYKEVR